MAVRAKDKRGRRGRSFESKSWLFMRMSGVALVVLALLHFAITHITNDVADTGYAFVVKRWDNPLWRAFDWLLLALALLHGLNGVRWIIDDYVRSPTARTVVFGAIVGVSGLLFAAGTLTILTF
ncbi:MAG: succinate dehydrogenase, hydrophobic membrane anchor protein [Actinomycetota bacterium]|nr:succinate dehydrogenase, hydrophobic membrane anchor protein [Actinomycetota bacterium]